MREQQIGIRPSFPHLNQTVLLQGQSSRIGRKLHRWIASLRSEVVHAMMISHASLYDADQFTDFQNAQVK